MEGGGAGWSWKFWEFEVSFMAKLPWRTKKGKGEKIFPLLTEHDYDL
jgi:hypothetical protein